MTQIIRPHDSRRCVCVHACVCVCDLELAHYEELEGGRGGREENLRERRSRSLSLSPSLPLSLSLPLPLSPSLSLSRPPVPADGTRTIPCFSHSPSVAAGARPCSRVPALAAGAVTSPAAALVPRPCNHVPAVAAEARPCVRCGGASACSAERPRPAVNAPHLVVSAALDRRAQPRGQSVGMSAWRYKWGDEARDLFTMWLNRRPLGRLRGARQHPRRFRCGAWLACARPPRSARHYPGKSSNSTSRRNNTRFPRHLCGRLWFGGTGPGGSSEAPRRRRRAADPAARRTDRPQGPDVGKRVGFLILYILYYKCV